MKAKLLAIMVLVAMMIITGCVLNFDPGDSNTTTTPSYRTTELEPNNSQSTADLIGIGATYACSGAINSSTDEDWFKVNVTMGTHYIVETYQPTGSVNSVDTIVELYQSGAATPYTADDDDGVVPYSKTDSVAAPASLIYIKVYGKSSSMGDYKVRITAQ